MDQSDMMISGKKPWVPMRRILAAILLTVMGTGLSSAEKPSNFQRNPKYDYWMFKATEFNWTGIGPSRSQWRVIRGAFAMLKREKKQVTDYILSYFLGDSFREAGPSYSASIDGAEDPWQRIDYSSILDEFGVKYVAKVAKFLLDADSKRLRIEGLNICSRARRSFAYNGVPPEIKNRITAILENESDTAVLQAAIECVTWLYPADFAPLVMKHCTAADTEVRYKAYGFFWSSRIPGALSLLEKLAATESDRRLGYFLISVLDQYRRDSQKLSRPLTSFLSSPNAGIREGAIDTVDPNKVENLDWRLFFDMIGKEQDPVCRYKLGWKMLRVGGMAEGIPMLIETLKSKEALEGGWPGEDCKTWAAGFFRSETSLIRDLPAEEQKTENFYDAKQVPLCESWWDSNFLNIFWHKANSRFEVLDTGIFGQQQGEPISGGKVTINDRLMEAPYLVERKGLDILVNHAPVMENRLWFLPAPKDIPRLEQPPPIPAGLHESSTIADLEEDLFRTKSGKIAKAKEMFWYACGHFAQPEALKKICEFYAQMPCVDRVEVLEDVALKAELKNGQKYLHTIYPIFHPDKSAEFQSAREKIIRILESERSKIEGQLKQGENLFFLSGVQEETTDPAAMVPPPRLANPWAGDSAAPGQSFAVGYLCVPGQTSIRVHWETQAGWSADDVSVADLQPFVDRQDVVQGAGSENHIALFSYQHGWALVHGGKGWGWIPAPRPEYWLSHSAYWSSHRFFLREDDLDYIIKEVQFFHLDASEGFSEYAGYFIMPAAGPLRSSPRDDAPVLMQIPGRLTWKRVEYKKGQSEENLPLPKKMRIIADPDPNTLSLREYSAWGKPIALLIGREGDWLQVRLPEAGSGVFFPGGCLVVKWGPAGWIRWCLPGPRPSSFIHIGKLFYVEDWGD